MPVSCGCLMCLVMCEIDCGARHPGRLSLSRSVGPEGNLKKAGHLANPRYLVSADRDQSLALTDIYV